MDVKVARILVVMGVSSSGKSTIGEALASRLGLPFLDADAWHPQANVEKMRAGVPLTDEDRWPWLQRYAQALTQAAKPSRGVVGACSALRRAYRDYLVECAAEPIRFIYLQGDRALIGERIATRQHHYMPASLLDSQFETLEIPQADENALVVSIDAPVEQIVDDIQRRLISGGAPPPPRCDR